MEYHKTKSIYITIYSSNYLNQTDYEYFETHMIMPWWNQTPTIQIWGITFNLDILINIIMKFNPIWYSDSSTIIKPSTRYLVTNATWLSKNKSYERIMILPHRMKISTWLAFQAMPPHAQRIAMDKGMTTKHLTHLTNTRVTTYVSWY
jgi:hypothetical protein